MPYVYKEHYYDLVELPSGLHIPVPMLEKEFPFLKLETIPHSMTKRGWNFFRCPLCGTGNFFHDLCSSCYEDWVWSNNIMPLRVHLYNEYIKEKRRAQSQKKLELFTILSDNRIQELKYIPAIHGKKVWVANSLWNF